MEASKKDMHRGDSNSIPNGWQQLRLTEFTTNYKLGGNYKNNEVPNNNPLIKMGNVGRGSISLKKLEYIADTDLVDEKDILKKGDLLFNTRNTLELVGKVCVWKDELPNAYYNSNLLRIEFDLAIVFSNYFMNYQFNSSKSIGQLFRIATGTTSVAAIYTKDLLKLKFLLPPLPEQKKIADILSTWDKAIETTQALIKKLQLRKKGLMQKLLTGKKRLPGFEGEWQVVQFKDIIKERSEYPDGDLPLYSLTIQDGVTPKTERYERSFLLTTTVKAYKKMCTNDFALNPMNLRFGAIAKHSGDLDVCVSKYYNIFYCLDDFNSTYFEYYLQSNPMIQYYNKMAIGSLEEKKRVHFSDFIKFKKQLPSFKEQTAIAQVLTKTDDGINQTQNYLKQLQEQKKGLMQQLLTGQKRVKV